VNERVVLTDKLVKSLRPAEKRYDLIDALVPGLLACVNPGGTVTMMLRTRVGAKSPIRRAIGQYGRVTVEQARRTAREWLELLYKGGDPQEVRRRAQEEGRKAREAAEAAASNTFIAVFDKFCVHKLKAQRRGFVVERIIRNELLHLWRERLIGEISHRDVREALEKIVERGATTYAHNVLDAARALFNFALERDLIEHNPCDRLKRRHVVGQKQHRERVLSDDELFALWRASGRLPYPFGPLYRLLILTGARLNEVAGARWKEFDLGRAVWTIPAARFKTGQLHRIPLTADAIALLSTLPRFRRGDCLFSTTFGVKPVNGFTKPKERLERRMLRTLRALARLRGDNPHDVELPRFVNHDIRRTLRTRLSALRVQDHIAEQVIGHGRKGIARVYDQRRFEDEKREALNKWEALLHSIVQPAPAHDRKVVALRKRQHEQQAQVGGAARVVR
jgi:integrase